MLNTILFTATSANRCHSPEINITRTLCKWKGLIQSSYFTKGMIWENLQIRSYQNCFWGVCSPFWLRNRVTAFHCILKSSFGNESAHFKSKLVFRRITFLISPGQYWLLFPFKRRKHFFSPLNPKECDWVEETFPLLSGVLSDFLSICCLKCLLREILLLGVFMGMDSKVDGHFMF